jgi:hypothetical protein
LSDISQVFSALFTNPLGVISALTNLDPTVTTDTSSLPITVGVELTPAIELGLSQLAAEGATLTAINDVIGQLTSDPSNALSRLFEAPATILNGLLNGEDNVSLRDGIITIPAFNGLLAPESSMTVYINLSDLVNALGLGSLNLSNLDLTDLLNQIGLGDLTLGQLFSDLNLSGDGLGTLLQDGSGITTLGGLWNLLGLGDLNESLTTALTNAGLLTGILDTPTVIAALKNISLGTLLGSDTGITTVLNNDAPNLGQLLTDLGISNDPLNLASLGDLTNLTLSDLLGDLGVGDLASISVDPFGGLITELVDTVPQQILAAL